MVTQFILENGIYGGIERSWYVWLCSNYIWGRDNELLCYIGDDHIMNDNQKLEVLTGLAEYMNAVLMIPMPLEAGWNMEGSSSQPDDLQFLNCLYKDFTDWLTDGYSTLSAKRYLIGHGTGGSIAELWLAQNPLNFTAAYFSDIPAWKSKISPLKLNFNNSIPTWFNGCSFEENSLTLSYWKMVNHVDNQEVIFIDKFPVTLWKNSNNAAQCVFCSEEKIPETWAFLCRLYDTFFDKIRRWRYNFNTGVSAWSPTAEEMCLTYVKKTVGGYERSWYYYIPDSMPPEKGFPVVLAYHGMKTNGKYYLEQSEWDRTAREQGFIILAPQGYHNAWNADENPNLPDDCHFTMVLLEWLEQQTSIDRSRIYAVGFSLGGAMVNRLLISLPWVFAGGCAKSGQLYDTNVLYDSVRESGHVVYQMQRTDLAVPMWQIMGEDEDYHEYMGDEHVSTAYWLKAAHSDIMPTSITTFDSIYDTRIYQGALAEYRFTYIKNIGHACCPGESDMVWTRFFQNLARPLVVVQELTGHRLESGSYEVSWKIPDCQELITGYLITSVNGRQMKEEIVEAHCCSITVNLKIGEPPLSIMVVPLINKIISRSYTIIQLS